MDLEKLIECVAEKLADSAQADLAALRAELREAQDLRKFHEDAALLLSKELAALRAERDRLALALSKHAPDEWYAARAAELDTLRGDNAALRERLAVAEARRE